ncbi:MAG: hypothetical protein ACPHJ3_16625 [Rubripirellula sp.]
MTSSGSIESRFHEQTFSNGYKFVDGVAMHAENGDRFQIPPDVIKKYITNGQFVELRLDSPRFSVHEDSPEKCYCESCQGEASKPILRHENPASLVSIPPQNVPSRGWGEDFWIRITDREGQYFIGVVDNPLYESRLHGLKQGDEVSFHADHMLAIHDIHRQEIVLSMEADDLKKLAQWLGSQQQ